MNPRPANAEHLTNSEPISAVAHSRSNSSVVRAEILDSPAAARTVLLLEIWRERRFIFKAAAYGLLLAGIISLLIPPKYQSTARLMPPEKRGMNALAGLLAASDDKAGSLVGGLVSDAMGVKSPSALYVGVLKSSTIQDALINRFDLRKVYRDKYMKDAREDLADNTDIDEDRKNGIITVTVSDRSPQRSRDLAQAYVENLNLLMAQLNTSAAHRERVFLEDRLKGVKQDLDAASKELSEFSSKNLTLDVKEQGKAMVGGIAALEGELIAAESQLSGLKQIYTPANVRVRSLQGRVDELKRKLTELRGNGSAPGEAKAGDFGMSIAQLPLLGVTYYDLYRRVKIQETVFEILTKQYELAKVNEAKELPSIGVLDEAKVPERKSTPKRFLIILIGTLFAAVLATSYVVGTARLRNMDAADPLSLFGMEMREGLADDVQFVRDRIPDPVRQTFYRIKARVSSKREHRSKTD